MKFFNCFSENEDQSIPLSEIKLDDENHLSPKSSTPNSAKNPNDCPCKLYPNSIKLVSCPMPSFYFEDGKRSVDFILVWDSFVDVAITEIATERRAVFEKNLMAEGLELEYEPVNETGLNFIKIHVPHEVLRRYSEILKLRMPMKEVFTWKIFINFFFIDVVADLSYFSFYFDVSI